MARLSVPPGLSIHVMPSNDLIEHDDSDECVCGPECEPVQREDGTFGWLYSHHSLDGRELSEARSQDQGRSSE